MKKKIVVTDHPTVAIIGANGQLGSDLVEVFGKDVIPLTRRDIDITDADQCISVIKEVNPNVVINTAAFHDVKKCEFDQDSAYNVNSAGAKNVANACFNLKCNAINCYISTDYVFDGTSGNYTENDQTRPVNVYGQSKLNGEVNTIVNTPCHYVFRVSSLFGKTDSSCKGPNFIEKIMAQKDKDEIVVDDVTAMSPTYTRHASIIIRDAIYNKIPYDTYHVCNTGRVTWYKFARKVFALTGIETPIRPSYERRTDVRIPVDSSMSNKRIASLGIKPAPWMDGLREYLKEKNYV
jgi:dTDP-4-dehydrorhamnose reductase